MASRAWVCGAAMVTAVSCASAPKPEAEGALPGRLEGAAPPATPEAVPKLLARHGGPSAERIRRGIAQVAALWREEDGDLTAFALEQFVPEGPPLDATFARLEAVLEQLDGNFLEMGRELRRPSEVEMGPLLPVDPLLAGYDPAAHLTEDLFQSKLAFVALLNFPLTSLSERLEQGAGYSRRQWAEARLALRFSRRVPAAVQQEISGASARADLYVAGYNLWMHHVLGEGGEHLFPSGLRLISHWNLRDELKATYADPQGLAKQRALIRVMERIVSQTVPAAVIDNPRLDWNPFSNTVTASAQEAVEANAPASASARADSAPEPNRRYERVLAHFHAARKADAFSPSAPTLVSRSFELQREMPEARVVALLEEVLTSPHAAQVAALIRQRLGRALGPQDLWYNGFQPRGRFSEAELDAKVRARYPTVDAFVKDLSRLLRDLGFAPPRADYLAARIKVDPSRGAGHAMQAARRGDFPRLRTRVEPGGMNYKGYNIAVHELGHNVEQVFSLYDVDHTLLAGVPNTAFTEALAFVFQSRDLELLGLSKPDAESERLRVLNTFWQTFEIAGVALVDLKMWRWLYAHPQATPAQLNAAVQEISRAVWNRYYAPLLGAADSVLLGIYSHMVAYPLYLPDYPLGHLIAFQIEEHLRGKKALGPEFERMAKYGAVTPDLWMQHATGAPVSAASLLRATDAAVSASAE